MARQQVALVSVDCEVSFDATTNWWTVALNGYTRYEGPNQPQEKDILPLVFNEQSARQILMIVDAEAIAHGLKPSQRYQRIRHKRH